MSKHKWLILLLFLLLVAMFQFRTASGEGQTQQNKPEGLIEAIQTWAKNALQRAKGENIGDSSIKASSRLTNEFWGKEGGYSEMTNFDKWLIHLSEHESCKIEGTPDNGSPSFGPFCYKEGTWIEKIKDIRESGINILPYSTDEELMNWVGDWDVSFRVTKWVVENQRDWSIKKGWFNTIRYKVGEPPIDDHK